MLLNAFSTVLGVLNLVILAFELWALIDAAVRPAGAYLAADKQAKGTWLALLGLGFAVSLFLGWMSLFGLLGVIAAIVYAVDVRPALREATGRGGSSGPYGPW